MYSIKRSSLKGLLRNPTAPAADSFVREGSDEDDRCAVALRDQTALQLDPAQTGHLHIRDHTRRVIRLV